MRERRASRVASEQGLTLKRTGACCGGDDPYRYNLIYERYGQPAATHLKLDAIEAWLGIYRKIPRH